MSVLLLGLVAHLIPASTVPAGLLKRATTEPLAEGRDEVIYLICSHRRVALGRNVEDGWRKAYPAKGGIGGPFAYDADNPWAQVRFPEGVRPSALGWAVLDPLLESVEGLQPDDAFDASKDPEGEDGRHRQELLPWVYDRHLELDKELEVDRGEVRGGEINLRLEYIGKAGSEALMRASGAHHKLPLILATTLAYSPERLVYTLPSDIYAATFDPASEAPPTHLPRLTEAVEQTGLSRDLLIAAAEEALIASVGAPHNSRNTKKRLFPASDAGEQLVAHGIEWLGIAVNGIPQRMRIRGQHHTLDHDAVPIEIKLT